ncbi:alpha/beta-hydrolase, partial [Ramaria rubella]
LIFDYRGFGASGGQPRNLVTVERQLQDYRSVIEYARAHPDMFHSNKIIVAGSAFSGLHIADLVVNDPGLAGGMAHCPLLDGYAALKAGPMNFTLVFWALVDSIKGRLGLSPTFVKAIGKPGELAFLTTPSCHPGFVDMFAQGNTPFSEAPNVIAGRAAFETMAARPGLKLKDAKCPVLFVRAEDHDVIPATVIKDVIEAAGDKVEVCVAPGGHFEVMRGGKGYETNIRAQVEFLRRLL